MSRWPLLRSVGGEEVKVQPRPLAVWQGTVVTLAALQVCIRTARAALGDEAQEPHYTESVLKRLLGYSDEQLAQYKTDRVIASQAEITAERQTLGSLG